MIRTIVCIEDKEAKLYNEPKVITNKVQAMRDFIEMCNDDKYPFKKYPEQFRLVKLGVFDDETGEFLNEKEVLLEAKTCKGESEKK